MDDDALWAALADEGFSVRPDGRAAVLAAAAGSRDATALQRAWLDLDLRRIGAKVLDVSLLTSQAGVLAGPVILQVESVARAPSAAAGGCVVAAAPCVRPPRPACALAPRHAQLTAPCAPSPSVSARCSHSNATVRLTDGHVALTGVEHDALSDGGSLQPGVKVGLVAVPVRAGCLLLSPDNCTVLGACVEVAGGEGASE